MITKPEATTSQPGKNLRCWDILFFFKQTNSLRRAPVVPKIALKDKGIGLMAMPAGLTGKVGHYRWSAM